MCGFAGFIQDADPKRQRPLAERKAILRAMSRQLARRGPDEETFWDDGTLAFTFRRLSIVDVAGGRQPIWNEDRSVFVSVNGEIYNHMELRGSLRGEHAFSTRSDSEIVLHLYEERGPALLPLLNGMFAAVLWDIRERRLTLARDRLGIKPLYYARTADGLLFASELKALLVHPDCPTDLDWNDIDVTYIDQPTYFPVTPGREPTYVKGVESLPGGSYLTFAPGRGATVRTWWSLEPALERSLEEPALPAQAYVDGYAELIADSVSKRLMSDVPVGAFLSGGLDSSLVVALAARGNRDLHCYSILQHTTLVSGDAQRARDLARHLGLPFHPVRFDREDLDALDFSLPAFEYFIWMMDGPKLDPDWLFKHELHRFAKTATPAVKVMLLGQGADEFAGGYSRSNGRESTWSAHLERRRRFLHALRSRTEHVPRGLEPYLRIRPPRGDLQHDDAREALEHLRYHNLWHEDRTSSSQGIEARVPFLDHRLVEYLAAIPPAMHAELFLDKAIIRAAARRSLPAEIASAPKVPSWLSVDPSSTLEMMRRLARRVYAGFREAYLGDSDLLDADAIDGLHERTEDPGEASVEPTKLLLLLMSLAVFERLCRQLRNGYEVRALGPPSPLREEPDFAAPQPAQDRRADPASLEAAQVQLAAGSRILLGIEGKKAYLLGNSNDVRAEVELEGDDLWVAALLRQVSERPGSSTAELARGVGREPVEVRDAVAQFLDAGWLELSAPRRNGDPA